MWYKLRFFEPSGDAFLLELDESSLISAWAVGGYGMGKYLDVSVITDMVGSGNSVAAGATSHSESYVREIAAITKRESTEPKHSEPNQGDRGATITHIILHGTAGSYAGAISWLCNPVSKVSAHRMVSDTDCPVLIWPTDTLFKAWVEKNL